VELNKSNINLLFEQFYSLLKVFSGQKEYNGMIIVNEILHVNIIASVHSGTVLSVTQQELLNKLGKLLVNCIIQSNNNRSSSNKHSKRRKGERSSMTYNHVGLAHSAARVLMVAPRLFFTNATDMLEMLVVIPSLGKESKEITQGLHRALNICMNELANLPTFLCVNERGVAYRNTPDRFDRYEKVRGPESGTTMVALVVGGEPRDSDDEDEVSEVYL
jgi:hypothetical protein